DDAIVVVENVERHIREGMPRVEAAIQGARELVGPIVAMAITLVAVYIPIGFQAGLTGALFREFAFTLAGAVFVSGFVALTLSPVMSARLLPEGGAHGRLAAFITRTFERLRDGYRRALDASLAARGAVIFVWMALGLATIPMFLLSPRELAPTEDQSAVFTSLQAPANASLEQMVAYTEELNRVFEADP